MAVKMRRNFSGAFSSHISENGTWRITRSEPPEIRLIIIGADAKSIEACGTKLYDPCIDDAARDTALEQFANRS